MDCPTCGRHVDRCPTCGLADDEDSVRGELIFFGLLLLMCALGWLVHAIAHPRAGLHELAALTPFGLFVLLPLALILAGWWGRRVLARPGDERPRPRRRAESAEGSE